MGSEEEGRKALASVYALNASTISTTMVPWNEILESQGFGVINAALCEKNKTVDYYGVTFRNFSAPAFQTVFEQLSALFNAIPDSRGSTIQIETFSNIAQAAVPENSTAYPWRDALGHVYVFSISSILCFILSVAMYSCLLCKCRLVCRPTLSQWLTFRPHSSYSAFNFEWTNETSGAPQAVATLGPELRDTLVSTAGYDGLACYANYAHGDESPEALYSQEKLPRLSDLKAQWDPDQVFSYYNAVPLPQTC